MVKEDKSMSFDATSEDEMIARISEEIQRFDERLERRRIVNEPVRPSGMTYMDAIMSDEADFEKQGLIGERAGKVLARGGR